MSKKKIEEEIEELEDSKKLAIAIGIHQDRLLAIQLEEKLEPNFKITQADLLKLYEKYYPGG